jgi:hypothetical protein
MNLRALFIALIALISSTYAAEPPPLERNDAKRILEHMEWKEVSVIAIRQGIGVNGAVAPIYATIVGFGTRDSRHQQICQVLVFDKEIGWHHLEMLEKTARIWTRDGYKETKIWTTW